MQVRDVMHKETHVIKANSPKIERANVTKDLDLECRPVEEKAPAQPNDQMRADQQEIDVMTWEGYNDLPVTME